MARWHTGIAPRPSGLTGTETFAKIGPLVSIGREPPQNSTDNPINNGTVLMRYSIRSIKREHVKDYLPQNPWIDHISSPMNDGAVDLEGISAFLNEEEFQVLIIEDYNATGIIGDPYQHRPGFADASGSEYDVSTKANTFYWFSRALAVTKPKSGRGGSWGLGKLAAPLASVKVEENTVTSALLFKVGTPNDADIFDKNPLPVYSV